jgi:DNA-binding response OmpR family regulator
VTAGQLRRNPQTSRIRVVLITARAQEDDKNRGREIGVDAYLTKPFDPGEMIRVVRELAGAATSEAREAGGAATAQAGALGETSGPDNETGHLPGDRPGPS